MDQATIAYWLTWVGTGAWVICFWWMHRISARQDALLTELRELAQTQHDILREVHPDVGEIKEYVVTEQGEKIDAIAQQVTQVADRVIAPEAVSGQENATGTAAGKP
jgi:DNA-binding HxlR family transcriptional regulator